MNNDWTDIIKQSALEGGPELPSGDFELLQSRYTAHRRRAAWLKFSGALASAAAMLALALILWPRQVFPGESIVAERTDIQEIALDTARIELVEILPDAVAEIFTPHPSITKGEESVAKEPEAPTELSVAEMDTTCEEKVSPEVTAPSHTEMKAKEKEDIQLIEFTEKERRRMRVSLALSKNQRMTPSSGSPLNPMYQTAATKATSYYAPVATAEDYNSPISYSHIPVPMEFGLSVKLELSSHWALNTGLKYTLLKSNCGMPDYSYKLQDVHYLGVPVTLDYYAKRGHFLYYVGGGVMPEKCMYAHRGEQRLTEKGLQCALMANAGIEYGISRHLGVFIEPDLSYYITKSDITTRRSSGKTTVGASVGLRINLD